MNYSLSWWIELADLGFVPRGQLVPCTQDHVHNEICAFYGDAPINTPVRRDPTKGRLTA